MMRSKNQHQTLSRRQFIQSSGFLLAGTTLAPLSLPGRNNPSLSTHQARYYQNLEDGKIRCQLCPWGCVIDKGKRGGCKVRQNKDGELVSLVYGRVAAWHNDPVEKKPVYHFLPGSQALSIATAGCNLNCKFCQNWELAQRRPEEVYSTVYSPEEVVWGAKDARSESIAYTYNEPVIFTEFLIDIAGQARESGIRSIVVSNGFIQKKPLRDICKVVDAYKVDLKAFSESYYRDIVGGQLKPVLDTLITLKEENVWSEIVYLIVPGYNDSNLELKELTKWILENLGPDVPVHFSKFYPKYKLNQLPPTPMATLEKAYQMALDAGLHYVYLGNVPSHPGENTYCPNCGKAIISRIGYVVQTNLIQKNQCPFCHTPIPGIWREI